MKKKKSAGGGANWMDTYGDMVTLLLCFFVLLYSISTISEESWKNLVRSFNPYAVADELPVDNSSKGPSTDGGTSGTDPIPSEDITQTDIDNLIEELYQTMVSYAAQASMSESVSVVKDGGRIYVNFKDTAFFGPNSPDLLEDSFPVLDEMCGMLSHAASAIDSIVIQGHTAQGNPDRPNNTRTDRRLSSERATNVVIYIQDHTENDILDPGKLVSQGMGQWHPVDTNDTSEGRANNRRVTMIISGRDLETEIEGNIESYTTTQLTTG